jgi:RimJ/RimL family protein N-acetyltransferase
MEVTMFTLHTERLILRDFEPNDFDAFFATTNDPEYQQFYAEEEMTRPFWQKIFAHFVDGTTENPRTNYQLAICLPDGTLIGTCGVRLEDVANRQASFGCAMGRPFWGHGYATEACHTLFAFAFTQLDIHRIYANTKAKNSRACVLAEHLGMQREGILRQTQFFRGEWWDTAVYAILKNEWNPDAGKR